MDSRKRAVAIILIVLVIALAVWKHLSEVQERKRAAENAQMKVKKPAAEQAPAKESVKPVEPSEKAGEQPAVAQPGIETALAPPQVPPAVLPAAAGAPCRPDAPAIAKRRSVRAPEGMVYVAGGPFLMGNSSDLQTADDAPAHRVCINGFYIDKYEVTNAQFKKFVDATGYVTDEERNADSTDAATWRHPYGPDSNADDMADYPVVCVTWNDANAFARWADKRLPTEAEWEKAARGPDGRIFPWGNTNATDATANVADKTISVKWGNASINDAHKTAAPVGSFPKGKSVYGAEDMAGNVWEWCADWWGSGYYKNSPPNNPTGPNTGEFKTIRGGSWFYNLDGARTTQRMYFRPEGSSAAIGFRCVADAR